METYTLPNLPPPLSTIQIAYFVNVQNASDIRSRLVKAATTEGAEGDRLRDEVDYAFIDASMIMSREHLHVAILAAALTSLPQNGQSDGVPELKTRSHNIHSEVLCALSPNRNISEAIRKFGVGDETRRLVVVRYGGQEASKEWERISKVVDGELRAVDELESQVEWSKIDKMYKLAEMNQLKLPPSEVVDRKRAAIINIVAVKHAM